MKNGIRLVLAVLSAPGLSIGTAAAQNTVTLLPSPVELPRRIGPLLLTGEPHVYEDPALGVSYQYRGDGLSLTVYVYNGGDNDIRDGADTIPVCLEYEISKQGVAQTYQKAELKSERLVRLVPPSDQPLAREAVYEYERDQNPTISIIWITAAAKHFVKLRFSVDPRLRDELPEARRAVLSILGEAIGPHLSPVDPKAEAPGTSMNLNIVGGEVDTMAESVMYLGLMATIADQSPEQAPVCGGEFVPSLEAEAGVFRSLFALGADFATTKPGKRIAQIDKAGFLEEFLWVDRHREAWGETAPQGLDLSEYTVWRKKNLKRFRAPEFGSVSINHPRPLPLEPLEP